MSGAQTFTIPGDPKGKMRPRSSVRGGHVHVHDDPEQVSNEQWVKTCARAAGITRIEGCVAASITVHVNPPKNLTRAQAAAVTAGTARPAVKPDVDNVAKLVLDALNRIAYDDDSHVVSLAVERHWTDSEPYVDVTLAPAGLIVSTIRTPKAGAA